jgi:hypothetical protein
MVKIMIGQRQAGHVSVLLGLDMARNDTRAVCPPRRTMNDVSDGLLLDVREVNFIDLDFADAESALSKALRRLLDSNSGCNFNSFNSSI